MLSKVRIQTASTLAFGLQYSPTHLLDTIVIIRTMSTSETFWGSTGIWMLRSAQKIHLPHLMLRVSAIFFFLEWPASLSPPEKNLILMKTEKQFEKNLRSRKKLSSSIPGKEGSQPTFHNCQKHPSCLFSFCNNHWSFCSVILQFFKRWILL